MIEENVYYFPQSRYTISTRYRNGFSQAEIPSQVPFYPHVHISQFGLRYEMFRGSGWHRNFCEIYGSSFNSTQFNVLSHFTSNLLCNHRPNLTLGLSTARITKSASQTTKSASTQNARATADSYPAKVSAPVNFINQVTSHRPKV